MHLSIDPLKVERVIIEARAFDSCDDEAELESGFTGTNACVFFADSESKSAQEQLLEAIRGMDEDEQIDLVTLAWIGRGTFSATEWSDARSEAAYAHNDRTAEYLTKLPMLGDYLEEGLAAIAETSELGDA